MNWAVDAARAAVSSGADWGLVGSRIGFLTALSVACSVLATRAFGAYQRGL
jgi:ABC-2 type transport system permease protein